MPWSLCHYPFCFVPGAHQGSLAWSSDLEGSHLWAPSSRRCPNSGAHLALGRSPGKMGTPHRWSATHHTPNLAGFSPRGGTRIC